MIFIIIQLCLKEKEYEEEDDNTNKEGTDIDYGLDKTSERIEAEKMIRKKFQIDDKIGISFE